MIDSNSIEEGPFGPDRTGSLPVRALIKLCFSGEMTERGDGPARLRRWRDCLRTWERGT